MTENRANSDKFMLRLPDGMRQQIKESAEKSGRSMNAEIIQRLSDSFQTNTQASSADIDLLADLAFMMLVNDSSLRRLVLSTRPNNSVLNVIAEEAEKASPSDPDREIKRA